MPNGWLVISLIHEQNGSALQYALFCNEMLRYEQNVNERQHGTQLTSPQAWHEYAKVLKWHSEQSPSPTYMAHAHVNPSFATQRWEMSLIDDKSKRPKNVISYVFHRRDIYLHRDIMWFRSMLNEDRQTNITISWRHCVDLQLSRGTTKTSHFVWTKILS